MDKFLADDVSALNRYLVDELKPDPNAEILHFKPTENGRDEFGNRIFSSPLSYVDRENNRIKAAMLVSPDGEKFIYDNKGVLKDIDKGIKFFSDKMQVNGKSKKIEYLRIIHKELGQKIEVSGNRTLSLKGAGGQSLVFLLEIGGDSDFEIKKYIIKTNTTLSPVHTEFNQPYINEMLQVQTIDKVLGKDLKELDISVSKFLFATGHVSCSEYAEKDGSPELFDVNKNIKLNRKLSAFIIEKNKTNDLLWKGVGFDVYDNEKFLPDINMVKTKNGIVWVDPVYHFPELAFEE